jgi:glutamate synthase domain-containing protein 1
MCGIAGYLARSDEVAPVGAVLLDMLGALGRRGPDSAGLAMFGRGEPDGSVCCVRLPDAVDPEISEAKLLDRVARVGRVIRHRRVDRLVRLVIERSSELSDFLAQIERPSDGFEVVSLGRRLELMKQVGSPANLDAAFGVAGFRGSHGIGHTRLSTESRVDLSHSQPFWARGIEDLAIVHNGHITNYDRLRRIYEQKSYRFFTHNDSEVIAVYLADRLHRGASLDEAVRSSLEDFDGSFTYLFATPDAFGYARDPFALKPLITVETPGYIAVANEEVAIRAALGTAGIAHEPSGHVYRIYDRVGSVADAAA